MHRVLLLLLLLLPLLLIMFLLLLQTLQGMDTSSVRVNETAAFGRGGVNATTPLGVGAQLGQRILFGAGQQKRGMFLRRSLPSMQSAERAVRRAKDALGTAMDDLNLGLTPPPVSQATPANLMYMFD